MKNPRKLGDKHVIEVHQALIFVLNKKSIGNFPKTVRETVNHITNLFPNIISVRSKFQAKNTNTAKDLTLTLDDNSVEHVNLFLIKRNARIQIKNLGAKSFFEKYFLAADTQEIFNIAFNKRYKDYLKELAKIKLKDISTLNQKELRHIISVDYPKFVPEIEIYRQKFLYHLREESFILLKDFYNERNKGFDFAYHSLFMTEDTTIITRYGKYESSVTVENFSPSSPYFTAIEIYKSGRNSVGIKYGNIALTLRFKFESGPTSSVKLAVSYETFPSEAENEAANKRTVREMSTLIENHHSEGTKNQSNAIGKCHEAITYYYFLQYFPSVSQVEPNECVEQLIKYYQMVNSEVLKTLYHATSTIIPAIKNKLFEKYLDYEIESVELVPESYIENRLDTGDLKLTLRVNNAYEIESISLKAVAKKGSALTTKNPGIGTILGPTYFNIGDLTYKAAEVREKYLEGRLNHRESLEEISNVLGVKLKEAPQYKLKRGIENLLGKAMMGITFYKNNESVCKEHSQIEKKIEIHTQTPSAIQNKLTWNLGNESINLRVKFSKSQKYGWSSIKLTSEYKVTK